MPEVVDTHPSRHLHSAPTLGSHGAICFLLGNKDGILFLAGVELDYCFILYVLREIQCQRVVLVPGHFMYHMARAAE